MHNKKTTHPSILDHALQNSLDRRTFCKASIVASVGAALSPPISAQTGNESPQPKKPSTTAQEWRNRQSGMTYRTFGNTGMMVSEIAQGTALWEQDRHLESFAVAFERGINYIDTAPAYRQGKSEKLLGKYLKNSGNRNHLFISNKISFYDEYMGRLMSDILKGLPEERRKTLRRQADAMVHERGVLRPGYHIDYWKGQDKKTYTEYLRYTVFREYGNLKQHKYSIKQHMHQLVERSLRAVGTEYFDVLHCPHGVAMPELLESDSIR